MKKLIATLLSLIMLLSLAVPTFAAENKASVEEVNGVRTVVTSDSEKEYTVVYDLGNQVITFTEKNLDTGVCSSATLKVNEHRGGIAAPSAVTIEQDTDSKFYYAKTTGNPNKWRLERPALQNEGSGSFYFKCDETSSNTGYISTFKSAVTTLANNEATLRNKAGAAKFSSFITGVLTGFAAGTGGTLAPAAISALLITVGLTGEAKTAAEVVANQCNLCMSAYFDVYYNSDAYF